MREGSAQFAKCDGGDDLYTCSLVVTPPSWCYKGVIRENRKRVAATDQGQLMIRDGRKYLPPSTCPGHGRDERGKKCELLLF